MNELQNIDPLVPKRHTGLVFSLDANRINARQKDDLMNQLELWESNGVIDLYFSGPAAAEVQRGSNAVNRVKKIQKFVRSKIFATTFDEQKLQLTISNVLFRGLPKNANEQNDVEIVFNAHKYGRPLITQDGDSKTQPAGILGNRSELELLGIRVWSTSKAVQFIKKRIRARDRRAQQICSANHTKLPDWVGQD